MLRCKVKSPAGGTPLKIKLAPLFPLLFGLFIDELEHRLIHLEGRILDLNGKKVPLLDFLDDLALLNHKSEGIRKMLVELGLFCEKKGLKMNLGKTIYGIPTKIQEQF